ncbi:MAG: hypothetical protein WCW26_03200, partial [Candidatus Buchananbacteria bacterium]
GDQTEAAAAAVQSTLASRGGPSGSGGTGGSGYVWNSSELNQWATDVQPGVTEVRGLPGVNSVFTRSDHHPSGPRAADAGLAGLPAGANVNDYPEVLAQGNTDAEYLMNNAERLGIDYVIWNKRIWVAGKDPVAPASQWREMKDRGSNTSNHRDHIHISW